MMRKILVVAPNWIGDALMAQPLFAQIKARHPRAQIHAIAPKWVAPVLARMPEIARVLPTDLAHGKLQLGSRTLFAQQLKNETFDAAYVLPNSFKSALIPWLAGIPLRIGYKGESRLGVLNVRYPNPPKSERPPMVQHYAALAFKPGAKLPDTLPDPKLNVDVQRVAATSAKFGIPGNARLVAFCPGAEYGPAKRWPAEHFAELAQMLRRSFPYAQIITLGSGKDREMADAIVERAPFVRNLCGETSLDEAIDLLARRSRHLQRFGPDARDGCPGAPAGGRIRLQRPAPHAAAVARCEYHVAPSGVQPVLCTRMPAGPLALPARHRPRDGVS